MPLPRVSRAQYKAPSAGDARWHFRRPRLRRRVFTTARPMYTGYMPITRPGVVHKHFRLNGRKLKKAQKLLGARTQTETIERALDKLLSDDEANRIVNRAHDKFLRSGIQIEDVYGRLEE